MNILLLLNKHNGCLKENVIPYQNLRVPKTELRRKALKRHVLSNTFFLFQTLFQLLNERKLF